MRCLSQEWLSSKAAANQYFKSTLNLTIHFADARYRSQVMHKRESRITVTARKSDLELTAHLLAHYVTQEIFKSSMRIGSYIKQFFWINACLIRSSDISYGIATGFPDSYTVLF